MGTPRHFELDPIDPEDRPNPSPPQFLKRKIYTDPKVFKVIDKHAVDEARTNYRAFRDLIWNLICKKEFSQLEKCRAIFRWMTTKNMYTIMFDSVLPGSPEYILSGFKDGKVTYARIFEVLCQYAGLHCVTISGWAKGVDYKPGSPITQTPLNHSWNAVHIDGQWQLVDSHWATRYLQNERNAPDNLVYEYDDFYFLSEPGHLIYSHCPEDPAWQLQKPAISRAEYEDFPLVKSFFFSVGMEFLQQNLGVIYTKKGLYTITLGFARPAAFTFKLAYSEKMSEAIQGISLKRYIIQETTENRVTFYFRAPREGNYYLTLFAQTVGAKLKVENIFKAACEYKIVADEASSDIRPYPQCNDSNWGPGAPVRQYGLMPSHNTAILSAPNGQAELSFRRTKGDIRLFARVVRDGLSEATLEDAVSMREQDDMVWISLALPGRGEYGLEVYANDPEKEGDTFTHMCQYLVSFMEGRDLGKQYGQVYDRMDLGYSMQAQPELWQQEHADGAAGGHYGSLPRGAQGAQRHPGGGGAKGAYGSQGSLPGSQQYDRSFNSNTLPGSPGGQYPGGQYQGNNGSYSTLPARTPGAQPGKAAYGSASNIGSLSATPDKAGSYGSLPRGGSGGAAVVGYGSTPGNVAPEKKGVSGVQGAEQGAMGQYRPDQKNFIGTAQGAQGAAGGAYPGGKQVYEGNSAEWDGNAYRERSFRNETETTEDGQYRSTSQGGGKGRPLSTGSTASSASSHSTAAEDRTDMTRRMESVTIDGKKQAPGTALKGQRGGPGGRGGPEGEDFLPPPPPELMDQQYTQHGGKQDKPVKPPVEIVYVNAAEIEKQKQEDALKNQKPIEVVFQGGELTPESLLVGAGGSPNEQRKKQPAPGTLPKPGRRSPAPVTTTTTTTPSHSSQQLLHGDTTDPEGMQGLKKGDPRFDVIAGARAPSGAPQGAPAGGWTNPRDEHQGGMDDEEDFPPPPPLPSTLPPGQEGGPGQYGGPGGKPGQGGPGAKPGQGGPGAKPGQQGQYGGQPGQYGGQPGQYGGQPGQYGGPGSQQGGPVPKPGQFGAPGSKPGQPGQQGQYGGQPVQYGTQYGGPGQQQPLSAGGQYQQHYPLGGNKDDPANQSSSIFVTPVQQVEAEYKPHDDRVYKSSLTVTPPTSFRPVPVEEVTHAPEPAPEPSKPKPFKDAHVFEDVDTHAVEVSKMEHQSFRDLVWVLIYARKITNELEKARAIFLWLCSKDLSKLTFHNVEAGSPEEILMSLKKGQTTYAVVYETLCSYAGLHCKTLSGYAKGAEYKPGMKFVSEQGQHSWNAVLVDGTWRLVDCHWAARRLVGKKVTVEDVRYELDEYYFMPDPHQLIFTHFPDELNWQLLEQSISLHDFENLVPVKSAFFKYGLQIMSHKEAVIATQKEITIRIGCPVLRADTLAFTFTLAYNDTGKEDFKGMKLNRFGMQEMVDNVSFLTIRPPEQGSYRLIIYAKDLSQEPKGGADGSQTQTVYGGVCEYEVQCTRPVQAPQPFPPCVHTSWGPGDSLHKYHMVPLQKGAIFSTVSGQAEVRYQIAKALRFTAKLKSVAEDEKALAPYVLHRVVGDQAIFTITAPKRGEYGLEIYANDPTLDGNALFHAFQYLIICTEAAPGVEPLPVLPPGYLGAQPMYGSVGLSAASHADPYIQMEGSELEISFTTSQPLRMTSQLLYVSNGHQDDLSDYVLQQSNTNQTAFQLRLPKRGLYKYQLYALPYSDTSESLPGVYNYLINCHRAEAHVQIFPKQYGQWKEGCFLNYPQEGVINRSQYPDPEIPVRVTVPNANSVAIVIGEEWTQLDQKEGPKSAWEGSVPVAQHWGKESKMSLCANYGEVKASYSTLLEYSFQM